ncbi:MAG: MarR family transcriptional regulator [Myxococcales bacterium]
MTGVLGADYTRLVMEERLYFLLNAAQHELRQFVDQEGLGRTGLTSAQMGVLFFVARNDGCLLSEVGKALGVKSAAVTGLISRTEKTGVIRRKASAEDRRAAQLFLTPKGRRLLTDIHRLNIELNAALREGFSYDELAVVVRFLEHVRTLPSREAPRQARRKGEGVAES